MQLAEAKRHWNEQYYKASRQVPLSTEIGKSLFVCIHCGMHEEEHAEGRKCLFDVTHYERTRFTWER